MARRASEISQDFAVHAMTDVTGFGLVGHATEVAKASHIAIHIEHSKLPLLPGVLEYSRAGFCAGGLTSNEQFFGKHVSISNSVTPELRNVLFDPQTSGGLLIFCDSHDADALLTTLRAENIGTVEIGNTSQTADHLLTVT
jgi:selenide,water dikinase